MTYWMIKRYELERETFWLMKRKNYEVIVMLKRFHHMIIFRRYGRTFYNSEKSDVSRIHSVKASRLDIFQAYPDSFGPREA